MVVPQIIHFNRDFHYKSSILGYPYFWKHPYDTNPNKKTSLWTKSLKIAKNIRIKFEFPPKKKGPIKCQALSV